MLGKFGILTVFFGTTWSNMILAFRGLLGAYKIVNCMIAALAQVPRNKIIPTKMAQGMQQIWFHLMKIKLSSRIFSNCNVRFSMVKFGLRACFLFSLFVEKLFSFTQSFSSVSQLKKSWLKSFFSSLYRNIKEKRDAYVKRLNDIYLSNLKKSNVDLIRGEGKFVGKNSIAVGDKIYSADNILIAVGGYPTWPSIPGAEHGISSDGFFELEDLPKKSVVVGAGYIAVEMAGILKSLGSDVTQIIRKDKVLRSFDDLIVESVTHEIEHMGINLLKNTEVAHVEKMEDGSLTISTKVVTSLCNCFMII